MALNKVIYPCDHKELEDLPGECWEDIPQLDGQYRISSFGRVKRLQMEIVTRKGYTRTLQPKIMHNDISTQLNQSVNAQQDFLSCSIMREGKAYKFSIQRMVYYCFIQQFDLEDYYYVVYVKDGNGKNITTTNLALIDLQGKMQRILDRGRNRKYYPSCVVEYLETKSELSADASCRQIYQYDLTGKYIQVFPSLRVAAEITGCNATLINAVARGRQIATKGFLWRYAYEKKIDVAGLRRQRMEARNIKRGVPVSQYTLKGKRVAVFPTIADAARRVSCNMSDIHAVINGEQRSAGGYFWKRGEGQKQINLKGFVTGEQWRAQRRWKTVKIYKGRQLIATCESVKAAAKWLGVVPSYVSLSVSKKLLLKGYRLKYASSK